MTYFGYWAAPIGVDVFKILRYPIVAVAFFALSLGAINGINLRLLFFLFIALIASVNSSDMVYSFAKFAGLAVVIGLFSPLIRSEKGREIRKKLWQNLCWSAVVVVLLSLFWKVTELPAPVLYVKQGFPGITSHAMLFGPVAGIAAVYLLSSALDKRNFFHMFGSTICYLAVYASLSRVAIAAASFGIFAVLFASVKGGRNLRIMKLLLPIVLSLTFLIAYLPVEKMPIGFGNQNVFAVKGLKNTRARLWDKRLDEFKKNPLLGVGVGLSEDYGLDALSNRSRFAGSVEPGSAYLVVLSMTGSLGAILLIIILFVALKKLARHWKDIPTRRRYEIAGVGSLLFIHAGAEGWIYSPGGVMCLFFWLWLGMVGDSVDKILYDK